MRKIVTLTLFYTISLNIQAQYCNKEKTYIDAGQLKKIISISAEGTVNNFGDQLRDFYEILEPYGLDQNNIDSNPFFRDKTPVTSNAMGGTPHYVYYNSEKSDVASSASSASWQGAAINGIANFMAGRFKQEVLYMGIENLFDKIINPKNEIERQEAKIIKALFPNTYAQIVLLKNDGAYYTADLLYLRQLVLDDFEKIPDNLVTNSSVFFPRILDEKPIVLDLMAYCNTLVREARNGRPLNDIITIVSENIPVSIKDSTVYKITNIVDLISQALSNPAGSEKLWVNPAELTNLNDLQVRYFYGLMYEQLKSVPEFSAYLNETNINVLSQKIRDLILFANKQNTTYSYLKSKDFNLKTPEEILSHVRDLNQLFSGFVLTAQRIESLKLAFKLNDSILETASGYLHIAELFLQKDYQRAIPVLMTELSKYSNGEAKYGRTIAFVSQLASIEDAEAMEALLQAYSLPIGGSSIKRHSDFNLSINGYVGPTFGWETALGEQRQTRGNIGLTAPIGVSATFHSKLTFFVSVFDLGSIVNVRLNNDTTSYSNLRFEHFFAPGIGAYYNCKKLPVSFGAHFNYIPNLRTIKYSEGSVTITETNTDVTRFNFSVLIDIPFFTLYNRKN